MSGNRPHRNPVAHILTCLALPDQFLLRPQLLTCLSALSQRRAGRLLAPRCRRNARQHASCGLQVVAVISHAAA
jgi:hypothetical protein